MSTTKKIVIVDSGVNNLWSVLKAMRIYAPSVRISEDPQEVATADALVLPGIGSFKAGMDGLMVRGLVEPIRAAAKAEVPILGICLGAQLLLERGFEFGEYAGLGIIGGDVRHFPDLSGGAKVPAIGWQQVAASKPTEPLFSGVDNSFFYFVHSYILQPTDTGSVLAKTTYGGYDYCAAVGQGRVVGVQFHPEKSGPAGMKLLENFVSSIQ